MKTTIWIREDDIEAWKALENKGQWIHDMLRGNATDLDRRIRKIAVEAVNEELDRREAGYS